MKVLFVILHMKLLTDLLIKQSKSLKLLYFHSELDMKKEQQLKQKVCI